MRRSQIRGLIVFIWTVLPIGAIVVQIILVFAEAHRIHSIRSRIFYDLLRSDGVYPYTSSDLADLGGASPLFPAE